MNFKPGIYKIVSTVLVRREPRIVEIRDPVSKKVVTNQVGRLTIGTRRTVYDVVTNPDNSTWGQISEPDAAGISQWMCLQNVNREFARRVGDLPSSITDGISQLTAEFIKLRKWAVEQGYEG